MNPISRLAATLLMSLLLVIPGAGAAKVVEGSFALHVTDPGSVPLDKEFFGTFTYDDSSWRRLGNDSSYYYLSILLIDVVLKGGDTEEACCYVLDRLPTPAQIGFTDAGTPLLLNMFLVNQALNSHLVTVGPNTGCRLDDPSCGLHWVHDKRNAEGNWVGLRGGLFTFDAPNLQVPEPSSGLLIGLGLLSCLLVRRHRTR